MLSNLNSHRWIKLVVGILIASGSVSLILVVLAYALKIPGPITSNASYWGSFGDYFGGVLGPIFGFLTLIAVLMAFLLQHNEMVNSVDQLRKTVDTSREQLSMLRLQSFESTLFQMLHLHNTIINSLEHSRTHLGNVIVTKGRDAIQQLADDLTGDLKSAGEPLDMRKLETKYELFYKEHQRSIGHYYRLLYNIFKFIDKSGLNENRFYSNLVRAQLSSQELVLLFYNCLTKHGREKFKPIIERYALLKTLPDKPFYGSALRAEYKSTAYSR